MKKHYSCPLLNGRCFMIYVLCQMQGTSPLAAPPHIFAISYQSPQIWSILHSPILVHSAPMHFSLCCLCLIPFILVGMIKSERIPGWALIPPAVKSPFCASGLQVSGESLLWNVNGQCITKEGARSGVNSSLFCYGTLIQSGNTWLETNASRKQLYFILSLLFFKTLLRTPERRFGGWDWSVLTRMLNPSDFPRLNQAPGRQQFSYCCSISKTLKQQVYWMPILKQG